MTATDIVMKLLPNDDRLPLRVAALLVQPSSVRTERATGARRSPDFACLGLPKPVGA